MYLAKFQADATTCNHMCTVSYCYFSANTSTKHAEVCHFRVTDIVADVGRPVRIRFDSTQRGSREHSLSVDLDIAEAVQALRGAQKQLQTGNMHYRNIQPIFCIRTYVHVLDNQIYTYVTSMYVDAVQ